jgi:hypothetical protein
MSDLDDLNLEDERVVAAFMSRVAALPCAWTGSDPQYLWWRATLERRREAERRARRPLEIMELVQIAGAAAAVAFMLAWSLPAVVRLF